MKPHTEFSAHVLNKEPFVVEELRRSAYLIGKQDRDGVVALIRRDELSQLRGAEATRQATHLSAPVPAVPREETLTDADVQFLLQLAESFDITSSKRAVRLRDIAGRIVMQRSGLPHRSEGK